jgi:5S rRNA maturation endonuclease (ribonuclease M5)
VHRDTGFSAVALLRTTLTDQALLQICALDFENVFVWLDPDEAGMKGAKKITKDLQHYFPNEASIKRLSIDREPKEHTPAELQAVLKP